MVLKTKIINILPHYPFPKGTFTGVSPSIFPTRINPAKKIESKSIPDSPFWIIPGDDFHVRLASSILPNTKDWDIECWNLYEKIDREYSEKINGITRRFFPAFEKEVKIPGFGIQYPHLISRLNKEIRHNPSVIIHLHGLHSRNMVPIYLWANLKNVPVVATQRGGVSPFFGLKNKPWLINHYIAEKFAFPNIDHFFVQSKFELQYIEKNYGVEKVTHFMDGIDFSTIIPIAKKEAREILGIPASKKVLLYVGHFTSNKPAKTLLSIYPKLKSEGIDLYFVGGYKSHNMYDDIISKVPTSINRLTTKDLLIYYSAADIHVYPSSNEIFRKFSSISNANMESLACNTPVYTSQLIHFLGNNNEKELIGIDSGLITDESKLVKDLLLMLNNLDKYANCRKIAKKYYDRSQNCLDVIQIYNNLQEKYRSVR